MCTDPKWLDEDDALDFVKNKIKNIVDCDPLEEVYKEEDRPRLQKDILQHYWDKASSVYAFIHANVGNCLSDTRLLNADGIPTTFATHFTDDFEYTVCKAILKELDRRCNPHKLVWSDLPDMDIATWYSQDVEKANELKSKIALLELQKKQLTARSTALKKPRGMKTGLFLFALFTATNIIFPLCLSPFRVKSYCCYLRVKIISITVFAVGLLLILLYLVYLLHWKKNQTNTST